MSFQPLLYRLYLASDLHIGSGVGLPGLIDEQTVRDQNDLAYVPASQIKGLVRDSCSRLVTLLGCDDLLCVGQKDRLRGIDSPHLLCGLTDEPACVLCALFGSSMTPGACWFSPAEYKQGYRDAVLRWDRTMARRDMAVSAHAAIDPISGRAAENQLFSLETVRAADHFEGRVEALPGSREARVGQSDLLGWLVASLLFTRRLGGRRRRGWGRCRFVLDETAPGTAAAMTALELVLKEKAHGSTTD